jgi:hypothetical protein
MSEPCDFCQAADATHRYLDDWSICDACFRNRRRARLLGLAVGAAIVVAVLQTCQAVLR